jgi:O-antigen/teichoic acid export membrane protein
MLGRDSFGELGIIQNTIGMFGVLAGLGMGLTANKHIAEFKLTDPERAGRILGLASSTAWFTSGVMAVVLALSAPWIAEKTLNAPHLTGLLQLGAILLFLSGINGAQTGALSGFEAFKSIARINLISGLLTFPLMVGGAWWWGVTGAVWGLIGSQLANCLLSFFTVRAEAARFKIQSHFAALSGEWQLFWRFSLPAVLTGVLNSLVAWGAGALVVNQAGGYGEMGVYNAALRVKLLPETFLTMLIAPMLPILSEAFGKGDSVTFERTLLFNFLLATLIIVPISLLQAAAPWLTLLPFGAGYEGHPAIVQWLMLHAVAYALLFPMGSILISMGRMWFSWWVNLVYALIFAGASLQLVPRFGAVGYAAALVVAYVLSNIACVVFLYREMPQIMRYLRWAAVALSVALLFGTCVAVSARTGLAVSIITGLTGAALFLTIKLYLHRSSIRGLKPAATTKL